MLLLLACFPELTPPDGLTDNPNVDYDGDGYTVNEGDCDDADAERYPGNCDTGVEGDTDTDTDSDTDSDADSDSDTDTDVAIAPEYLYFAELHLNAIYRSDLSTGATKVVVGGLGDPVGVAVDRKNGWVYWADGSAISRATLEGGATETVATDLGTAREVAVDATLERVCWTTTTSVQCKNFEGESVMDHTSVGLPVGIALDPVNRHVWWSEYTSGKIVRANLDGTGVTDVYTGLTQLSGIDLDIENERIFWTQNSTRLAVAPLAGGEIVDIVTTGLEGNAGIAWDGTHSWLYYSNNGQNQIKRVRLDGSDPETFVSTAEVAGLNEPRHVTLDGYVP